jgi:hypothetical protein
MSILWQFVRILLFTAAGGTLFNGVTFDPVADTLVVENVTQIVAGGMGWLGTLAAWAWFGIVRRR